MEPYAVFTSKETSWADQWDSEPAYGYQSKNRTAKSSSMFTGKAGEKFDKTKSVASTGAKKVKNGARAGFNWIKDKYQKTTHKH